MLERLPGIYEIVIEEREGSNNIIHLYLVKGKKEERNLLIDAAYSNEWCLKQLLEALNELNISPDSLDIFITHKHADHCGLAHALQKRGAVVFMNRQEDRHPYDCLYYRTDHSYEKMQKSVLKRNGITPEAAPLIWEKFMDFNQHLSDVHSIWVMLTDDFQYEDINEGQIFSYGDYRLEAISLRGHTYGQMGLVDSEKKLLFSADQVLNKTTPIVGTSYLDEHLLSFYLDSVKTIAAKYEEYMILAAHEGPVRCLKETVSRIIAAYEKKIEQTYALLSEDQDQTVWQIAKRLYGLTPKERSDAAFIQAKMITTKTCSILEYLYDCGRIRRLEKDGIVYWKRCTGFLQYEEIR